MELLPIESSSIAAAGYDEATQVLRIRFTSLAEYEYQGVPKSLYEEFLRAESKGSHFQKFIRACFVCECVVPRPKKEKADEEAPAKEAPAKEAPVKAKRTSPAI